MIQQHLSILHLYILYWMHEYKFLAGII